MKTMRKTLCAAITAAMILPSAVIPLSAGAADYAGSYLVNEKFTESKFYSNGDYKKDDTSNGILISGNTTWTARKASGLGGRSEDDLSVYGTAAGSGQRKLALSGKSSTADIITAETSIYVDEIGSDSVQIFFGTGWNDNTAFLNFYADGSFTMGDANTKREMNTISNVFKAKRWYKVALCTDNTKGETGVYLNGDLVYTLNFGVNNVQRFEPNHVAMDGSTTTFAFDDYKLYEAAYDPTTDTVTLPSTVKASDDVISVAEGTTLSELKELLSDVNPTIYADNTYTAEATELNDSTVVVVKSSSGEVFKYYTVKEVDKYTDGLIMYYDGASYAQTSGSYTGGQLADTEKGKTSDTHSTYITKSGLAGKADSALHVIRGTGTNSSIQMKPTNAYSEIASGVDTITAEVQMMENMINQAGMSFTVFTNGTDDGSSTQIAFNIGKSATISTKARQNKTDEQSSSHGTYTPNNWIKVAIEVSKRTGTAKIYLDGELLAEKTKLKIEKFYPDIRLGGEYQTNYNESAGLYYGFDNFRVYTGSYRGDDAVSAPASVSAEVGSNAADIGAYAVIDADGNAIDTIKEGAIAVYNNGELYKYVPVTVTEPKIDAEADLGLLKDAVTIHGDSKDVGFVSQAISAKNFNAFMTILADFDGEVKVYPFKSAFQNLPNIESGDISFGVIITNIPVSIDNENIKIQFTSEEIQ